MFHQSGIVLLISAIQFLGWQNATRQEEPCFVIPNSDVLVVIANQPNCPIEFVDVYSVAYLDGGGRDIYRIRNRATKPIMGYTIATIHSTGTGGEHSLARKDPKDYFLPGEIKPSSPKDLHLNIIPLTDQLRAKYHINGEMKFIKIFMVVRVEFADGSKYDATSEYESLKKFFEENPIEMEKEDRRKTQ